MFRSKQPTPANVLDLRNPTSPKRRFKRPTPRQTLIAVGAVIVLVVSLSTWWHIKHRAFFPALVTSNVTYPIYYPASLPKGFKVQKDSFSVTPQVMTFYLVNGQGQKIFISEQPKPRDFDFNNFYFKQLIGQKDVLGSSGHVVVGVMGNQPLASQVTDKTWVLITGSANMDTGPIQTVAKNLNQAD